MKKIIILAAAALATLASCTDVKQEATQAKIAFQAVNFKNNSTKVSTGAINTAVYPEDIPFGVFATYLADGKTWAANSADGASFMDDVECTFVDENYAPANTYYWPLQGSVTFQAYSPSTASASYDLATKTMTITDFTLGTDVTAQEDLMYSKAADACDKTQNEVVYNSYSTKGVQIKFRHALSQVRFYAKTAEDYSATTAFTVDNVEIQKVVNKGTLAVVDDVVALSSWTNGSETADFVALDDDATDINAAEYTKLGENVLVIPQTIADALVVEVTYTMYNADKSVNLGSKTVAFQVNTDIATFAPNKIYNIDMIISAEKILFSPVIVEWDDTVVEEEYELPEEDIL